MEFRRLPKIDLHLHLDGAVRTRTILELGDRFGVRLPAKTERRLEKFVTVGRGCRSLREYLDRFEVFLPVLRFPESMDRIAYELCEDQSRDGVLYFETRFAPVLQESPSCSLEQSVEAALQGLTRGGRDFGVRWGLILCFFRPARPESSIATVEAARRFRDRGVVGVDIAGDEAASASPHAEAFRRAKGYGLGITAHAGEAGPPENVWEAVNDLGATRIGHGSKSVEDPKLLEKLAQRGITFEVCLTSNLHTRSVPSLSRHPLAALRRAGIRVTLNTDDPAVSRITLSQEYARARAAFGWVPKDFVEILENSCDGAFTPETLKRELKREIRKGWGITASPRRRSLP